MVLQFVHYGMILIFGVYLSAAFIGIQMNRRNIMILLGFSAVVGAINAVCFVSFGLTITEQIYPLIIHLPLILFFGFYYKFKIVSAVLSVFVTYLCCQISNWVGVFFLKVTGKVWVYYSVRIITDIIVLILLIYFMSAAVAQLLKKPTKDIVIFGLIPFVYYLYDYAVTVYTKLFYLGGDVITEFLGFMLCVFYMLFLLIYFKQYEEKIETEQRNKTMEMQRIQSEKEIERIKESEHAMAIMRHDMRHYLNNIAAFIENGEKERSLAYICEIINKVDKTIPKKYCSNKIVNMILSSYQNKINEYEIAFEYSIRIPEELRFSDSDISAILTNGIENAVHGVSFVEKDKRKIQLDLRISHEKLLISIKNTYAEKPKIVNGLPQTKERGHGFGTQSICYITEKLKGNCQFTVDEEYFILRIVL